MMPLYVVHAMSKQPFALRAANSPPATLVFAVAHLAGRERLPLRYSRQDKNLYVKHLNETLLCDHKDDTMLSGSLKYKSGVYCLNSCRKRATHLHCDWKIGCRFGRKLNLHLLLAERRLIGDGRNLDNVEARVCCCARRKAEQIRRLRVAVEFELHKAGRVALDRLRDFLFLAI